MILKPDEEWRDGVTRDDLIEEMSTVLNERVPGVAFGFTQPIEMRVDELVAGVKADVAVLLKEATFETAVSRLRPILMTALVASLGFLPMALSTGDGAEMQRPLATVVIGGLVTSTLLTSLVVPAIYPWFASRKVYEASDRAPAVAAPGGD